MIPPIIANTTNSSGTNKDKLSMIVDERLSGESVGKLIDTL